jgi:hypothetical protein
MDAMVHMGHGELESVRIPGAGQQVQQRHRVGASGDGYERPAGRQCQGRDPATEEVDEGHVSS